MSKSACSPGHKTERSTTDAPTPTLPHAHTQIERASVCDVPRIAEIYNHAIFHTTATADCEPQRVESRLTWFLERQQRGYPVLVARRHGEVVGWAALNPYSPRYGYRFTAENSVYIAPEAQGQGVGTALMGELVQAAKGMGLHSVIAGVDSDNIASIRLHEKFGFVEAGRYKELVYKFDRWLDVVRMQLML